MTRPDFSPVKWRKLIFLHEKQGQETSLIYSTSLPAKLPVAQESQAAWPPGAPANHMTVIPRRPVSLLVYQQTQTKE
jgi:hypothetical protein